MSSGPSSDRPPRPLTRGEALAAGLLSSAAPIADVARGRFDGGPADGTRFIDLSPSGGLHLRVLPDRGFDIGPAWHQGGQLAWISKVGVAAPLDRPEGMSWNDRFGGGLLATCGLDNVGAPSEGVGLHGSMSHLRADGVSIERDRVGDEIQMTARGQLHDVTSLGRHLRIERTISVQTGRSSVTVVDQVTNLGSAAEPAPVLYHVNLGYPLWQPGAALEIASAGVRARDDAGRRSAEDGSWAVAPPPEPDAAERVYEHVEPVGLASVSNPGVGSRVDISWSVDELPRLYQWTHPAERVYAVALEPTNASALGRADDRAAGTLPTIEPDDTRRTSLTIEVVDI